MLLSLPRDYITDLVFYLPGDDLISLFSTCKYLQPIWGDSRLWARLITWRYPHYTGEARTRRIFFQMFRVTLSRFGKDPLIIETPSWSYLKGIFLVYACINSGGSLITDGLVVTRGGRRFWTIPDFRDVCKEVLAGRKIYTLNGCSFGYNYVDDDTIEGMIHAVTYYQVEKMELVEISYEDSFFVSTKRTLVG
jgi:hypothetical protein